MAKKRRNTGKIVLRVFLILLAVAGILLYTIPGTVEVDTEELPGSFTVNCFFDTDVKIAYKDIQELSVEDEYDFGTGSLFFRNLQVICGAYSSKSYGAYDLRINRLTHKYIVLKANDRYLVFNCRGENETVQCYNVIRGRLNDLITGS